MSAVKKQYLILLIPFLGFFIICFLVMFKYIKHLKFIEAAFYTLIPTFAYLVLVATIDNVFLNYPDNELFHAIVFYTMLVFVGFLMIRTQSFVLKKYGVE